MGRRTDPRVQRLAYLADASQRGGLSHTEGVELGRLVIEVGGMAGAGQARAKDRRILAQRREIAGLLERIAKLEAELSARGQQCA